MSMRGAAKRRPLEPNFSVLQTARFFWPLVVWIVFVACVIQMGLCDKTQRKSRLIHLVVLNRHGHRSPNPDYWQDCPADASNRHRYSVDLGQLTSMGVQQEKEMGKFLHQKYGFFIGDRYEENRQYIRAVGEPRTLLSALALTQGLFPQETSHGHFQTSRSAPIFSELTSHDDLLNDDGCNATALRDANKFLDHKGQEVIHKHAKELQELLHVCKTPKGVQLNEAVKDLVDGVIFNHDFGLEVVEGRLSLKTFVALRTLSNELLRQKLYGTDAQQTYMAMKFPKELLRQLEQAAKGDSKQDLLREEKDADDSVQPTSIYVAHREALYALAHFFGIRIAVPQMPLGELPVASSFIFAMYKDEEDKDTHGKTKVTFVVEIELWTPFGVHHVGVESCRNAHLCTLEELRQVYKKRIERTGTWETLCNTTR